MDNWWKEWREFMFEEEKVLSGKTAGQKVYEMLSPIKKSKYPAITEEVSWLGGGTSKAVRVVI